MIESKASPSTPYGRNTNKTDVLIIGAGISGLVMAIEMIRKGNGRKFIIVEQGNQVGGTWNDQRYPGCCCDVWSHLYSLSFEPNPSWTREYPGQEEILAYLIAIAHKYQLYAHIRFSTSVTSSRWDESSKTWSSQVERQGSKDSEFSKQYTITSSFLVSAVGQLNVPKYPNEIPGIDSFNGKAMHSARWDWDFDLRGKKVGIIGSGASAAQIIPEIAGVCESLTVFQRTPNWVIPRGDVAISPTRQALYKYVPWARRRYRAALMDAREGFFDVVFEITSPVHEYMMGASKAHMAAQLPGDGYAELREKLQPRYAVGCKRVIITDDFFPAFARENVALETGRIEGITEKGVSVEGREYDFDVLVYATGFKTTQFMYPIQIYGKGGKSIEDIWSEGASAYLGMTVPELPNFSMLYGPNTNLGHNSIILMIEAQAMYINTLITKIQLAKQRGGSLSIQTKSQVAEDYNNEIQTRLSQSAFADPNCNSWYKNEAGLITNNWSDAAIPYQKRTSFIDWGNFEIEGTGKVDAEVKGKTSWKRVVEETQVSNTVILAGMVTAAIGAIAAGAILRRGGLQILLRH
ncbi:FAD-binding monooxygenase [Lachnellula occidentalis]|uniref:FAD-binding monooxygenase n=1 Tax=Lachnellula occidentalis TaxID=215460 RepID=A0A8H8RIT9_9HELO|nr:FAD-binding monooxygenase [Lachnellula occidentalis]